jgi:hypothetical protein
VSQSKLVARCARPEGATAAGQPPLARASQSPPRTRSARCVERPSRRSIMRNAALLTTLASAVALGCGRESSTTDTEQGGSAGSGGAGNRGGSSAAVGGDVQGGSSGRGGTGGVDSGGTSSAGAGSGGTSPSGAGGDAGGDGPGGGSGGSDAGGGGGQSRWSMIGGCPSELCPSDDLPGGESCSVSVGCCQYQRLPESQDCTCTDGRWVCEPQRCACP